MKGLLGYMSFYFKVVGSSQVAYAKINNDFRKIPTEESIISIKDGIEGIYKQIGMDVVSVHFCSEKEYKENGSDDVIVEHEWNDELGVPKLN